MSRWLQLQALRALRDGAQRLRAYYFHRCSITGSKLSVDPAYASAMAARALFYACWFGHTDQSKPRRSVRAGRQKISNAR